MVLSDNDVRQSALFWALGHFFEKNLDYIANLFSVPRGLLISELYQLGFSKRQIWRLENNDHPLDYCRSCHEECTGEFCSLECQYKEEKIKTLLRKGLIPVTYTRRCLYNINTQKAEYVN